MTDMSLGLMHIDQSTGTDGEQSLTADPGESNRSNPNSATVLGTLDDGCDSWYCNKDERTRQYAEIISDITSLQLIWRNGVFLMSFPRR